MISNDEYGILNRLILNQKIEPSPEGFFRALGFVHLYTASGLHLIALESFLQRFFGKTLEAKKLLTVLFWFFLFLIWHLQGYRLGFARILVLFFLRQLAREKGFIFRVYFPLFTTFCFDFALGIEAGWQHYYLAVLGGMLGMEFARQRTESTWIQHCYLSFFSWVMTAPLDLFEHHIVSWMTPIWSLLTIPLISLFLYPISIFSYFIWGDVPKFISELWNSGMELLLKWIDLGFTFSVIPLEAMTLAFIVSLLVYFLRPWKLWVPVFGLILLIYRIHPIFHPPEVRLTQMNVGQGDSLLIQKNGRTELMDVGPMNRKRPEEFLFRMTRHGVTKIDALLLSHLDSDHAGGLKSLIPWVPLSCIELDSRFDRYAKIQSWIQHVHSLQLVEKGGFQTGLVNWISTSERSKLNKKVEGNRLMGTALIPIHSNTVYLSLGDSDHRQEDQFLTLHRPYLKLFKNKILKVSHHGSKHSTSVEWLRELNPNFAVLSVGRRNPYHHPHPSILGNLNAVGVPFHRTDRQGDFVVSHHVLE